MYELIYTSSPKGLIADRQGFTTVAMTDGFPSTLISPIENLSGYKNLFPPESQDASLNPVNYSFQWCNIGGMKYAVLSRISYSGLSYTGRSNNLACHLIFPSNEILSFSGGPTSILMASENFSPWSGLPRNLPARNPHTVVSLSQDNFESCRRLCGDEKWASVMAYKYRTESNKPIALQFSPYAIKSEEILTLISEITSYLTLEEKWNFTFSTYSYQSSIENPVFLRAYPENSQYLASIKRLTPESVIILGNNNEIPSKYLDCLNQEPCNFEYQNTPPSHEPENYPENVSPPAPVYSQQDVPAQQCTTQSHPELDKKTIEEEYPVEQKSLNKGAIAISVAVLLIACVVVSTILLLPQKEESCNHEQDMPVENAATSQPPDNKPSDIAPTKNPEVDTPVNSEANAQDAVSYPVKVSTKEKIKFTTEQRLKVFLSIKYDKSPNISLPLGIHAQDVKITAKFRAIGEMVYDQINNKGKVFRQLPSELRIYPVKRAAKTNESFRVPELYPDNENPSFMSIKLSDGNIVIQNPSLPDDSNLLPLYPRLSNMDELYISGTKLYDGKFSEDFIKYVNDNFIPKISFRWEKSQNLRIYKINIDKDIPAGLEKLLKITITSKKNNYKKTLPFVSEKDFEYISADKLVTQINKHNSKLEVINKLQKEIDVLGDPFENLPDYTALFSGAKYPHDNLKKILDDINKKIDTLNESIKNGNTIKVSDITNIHSPLLQKALDEIDIYKQNVFKINFKDPKLKIIDDYTIKLRSFREVFYNTRQNYVIYIKKKDKLMKSLDELNELDKEIDSIMKDLFTQDAYNQKSNFDRDKRIEIEITDDMLKTIDDFNIVIAPPEN